LDRRRRGGRAEARSFAPFDLLAEYARTGAPGFRELYREFALSTAGQRRTIWSPGLRAATSVRQEKPAPVTRDPADDHVVLGNLTYEQYRRLDAMGELWAVREVGRSGDPEEVARYVLELLEGEAEES
jgi:hypothetical protein